MAKKKKEAPLTGITVSKEEDFSGWYTELITKAEFIANPRAIIQYSVFFRDEELLKSIGRELKEYLSSKGYEAMILILEIPDLTLEQEFLAGSIITNANLNPV